MLSVRTQANDGPYSPTKSACGKVLYVRAYQLITKVKKRPDTVFSMGRNRPPLPRYVRGKMTQCHNAISDRAMAIDRYNSSKIARARCEEGNKNTINDTVGILGGLSDLTYRMVENRKGDPPGNDPNQSSSSSSKVRSMTTPLSWLAGPGSAFTEPACEPSLALSFTAFVNFSCRSWIWLWYTNPC